MRPPPRCCRRAVEAQRHRRHARAPTPPRSPATSASKASSSTDGRMHRRPTSSSCAVGIRPNADLARDAGLAVNRGIVVDDALADRASRHPRDRRMRRASRRLLRPGRARLRAGARARRAARGRRDARYAGSVLATNLKVSGVNVFSAGDFSAARAPSRSSSRDPGIGTLPASSSSRDGRLVGAVLFGDTADGLWYLDLIRSRRRHRRIPRRSRLRPRASPSAHEPRAGGVTCPAISPPTRSATSKASSRGSRPRARDARARCPRRQGASRRARRDPLGAGPRDGGRRQARRPGEVQARAASVRCLRAAQGAGRERTSRRSRRTISAGAITGCSTSRRRRTRYMCRLRIPNGILNALAVRGRRRSRRALRRRLCACDDARQSADPRDRAEERGRGASKASQDLGLCVARLRRRQHPQRHRHADGRHRPAGADRHAALRARMALPHPERSRALRPAAQVQCRASTAAASSRCWRTPTTSASRPSR